MNTIEFQPLITLTLAPTTGTGLWSTFETILQERSEILDCTGLTRVVIGIELLHSYVDSAATRPSLILQMTDRPEDDDSWADVFTTGTTTAANYILTLMSGIPLGEAYRLQKALRWKVTFGQPGAADQSRISFRITISAN